jgi:hypothetical protein
VQAAYAEHLGKDDSGAIAAFLDDPSTSLLQVSLAKSSNGQLQVRLTNSADFPKGCFYQVCVRACRQQQQLARPCYCMLCVAVLQLELTSPPRGDTTCCCRNCLTPLYPVMLLPCHAAAQPHQSKGWPTAGS